MRNVTNEELVTILEKHLKWLKSEFGGERADLTSADLRSADLRSADLRYADLTSADLRSADLRSADLRYADLRSADLTSADLRSADLTSADLRYADLTSANLEHIRVDMIAAVLKLPNELGFLRQAIVDGKIDGSTYEGECACLAGTLSHACHIDWETFRNDERMPIDSESPRERWFMGIKKGDTPETNQVSLMALKWVDEAIALVEHIRSTATVESQLIKGEL